MCIWGEEYASGPCFSSLIGQLKLKDYRRKGVRDEVEVSGRVPDSLGLVGVAEAGIT